MNREQYPTGDMQLHKKSARFFQSNIGFATALAALATLLVVSLCVGRYPLSPQSLLRGDEMALRIFYTLRLPRTLAVAAAGFGLSTAGFVYQSVFHNPLASPDIIGVSSGASTGAAAAILFWGGGAAVTALAAFSGGILAVALTLGLAAGGQNRRLATFVLSGIAVNATMQAILMLLKATSDPEKELASIEFWTMGSFAGVTSSSLPPMLLAVGLGMAGLLLLYRQLLLLGLDDDEAQMLGVSVMPMRALLLGLATMVVAAIVSVTGLITFVGLIAPHLARLIRRDSRIFTCLFSGAIGACLLLTADCAARLISIAEVPVSVFTSLLGAPFLFYLIRREGKTP